MYIAMNRFKVKKDRTEDFEEIWRTRERHLSELEGFKEFSLYKGAESEDYRLYSSHTVWESHARFEAWTKSKQFRQTHSRAGKGSASQPLTLGHPNFEGFEVILHEKNTAKKAEPS